MHQLHSPPFFFFFFKILVGERSYFGRGNRDLFSLDLPRTEDYYSLLNSNKFCPTDTLQIKSNAGMNSILFILLHNLPFVLRTLHSSLFFFISHAHAYTHIQTRDNKRSIPLYITPISFIQIWKSFMLNFIIKIISSIRFWNSES